MLFSLTCWQPKTHCLVTQRNRPKLYHHYSVRILLPNKSKPFDLWSCPLKKGSATGHQGAAWGHGSKPAAGFVGGGGGGERKSRSSPYQCLSLAPLSGADWQWRRACASWKTWFFLPSPAIHSGPASEFWWKGTTCLCSVRGEEKMKHKKY